MIANDQLTKAQSNHRSVGIIQYSLCGKLFDNTVMNRTNEKKKFMKTALTATLLLLLLCGASSAARSQNSDTTLINNFIAKQAAREAGEEYADARKVVAGDLNGDGTDDLAVLYTIEGQHGSNNHVQYLAVFFRVKGQLVAVTHAAVGGKSNRAVELESISKGGILLKTLKYAAQDASCCPSIQGTARYGLVQRKLKELKGVQ